MRQPRLIVIGAGPKAMAIAAKNFVLRKQGFKTPELVIIERTEVAAHWTGSSGFTNGRLPLGTSPEKDVGFPYDTRHWAPAANDSVNASMRAYSWAAFLVHKGQYSDWVDRGRPAPQHREWAQYLRWVYDQVNDGIRCLRGTVTQIQLIDGQWEVSFRRLNEEIWKERGDGLVLTGPGRSEFESRLLGLGHVHTVESFWAQYEGFRTSRGRPQNILVVGAGENAATVAMALAGLGNDELQINILSPNGMAFSRGESYFENRVYSSGELGFWNSLSDADKRNFIHRTDRGVFSQHAQKILGESTQVKILLGRLEDLRESTSSQSPLEARLSYDGKTSLVACDSVVLAMGGSQSETLAHWLTPDAATTVAASLGLEALLDSRLENLVGSDMAVEGLSPKLHLPMLSGLKQGPGFANLSCLGRLSDHILASYVEGKA